MEEIEGFVILFLVEMPQGARKIEHGFAVVGSYLLGVFVDNFVDPVVAFGAQPHNDNVFEVQWYDVVVAVKEFVVQHFFVQHQDVVEVISVACFPLACAEDGCKRIHIAKIVVGDGFVVGVLE